MNDDPLDYDDPDDTPCGVCERCPCNEPGCPVCNIPSETGRHGVVGVRAIVTGDIARSRSRFGTTSRATDVKREAHHRHRQAWRVWLWTGAEEERMPSPKPGTAWEVW